MANKTGRLDSRDVSVNSCILLSPGFLSLREGIKHSKGDLNEWNILFLTYSAQTSRLAISSLYNFIQSCGFKYHSQASKFQKCTSQNSKFITHCLITSLPGVGYSDQIHLQQRSWFESSSNFLPWKMTPSLTSGSCQWPGSNSWFPLSPKPKPSEIPVCSTFRIYSKSRHFFPPSTLNQQHALPSLRQQPSDWSSCFHSCPFWLSSLFSKVNAHIYLVS